MRNIIRFSKGELLSVLILLGLLFGATQSFSQAPSLGDPLFVEDFGNATTGPGGNGTSYSFNGYNGENTVVFKNERIDYIQSLLFYTPAHVPPQYSTWGNPNWGPRFIDNNVKMGSYSIATNSSGYKNSYFYTGYDHTTNTGKGYMLLVDAHSSTTLYFDRIVENLCAGTKFQFSVWVKDINRENNLPKPKITLDIYDNEAYVSNGGAVSPIATHTTDDSDILKKNTWYELKMDFDMPANVSTIRLQIRNAVEEFRGNDLAIDDITFRPMGPPITLLSNYSKEVCVGYDVAYNVEVSQGAYNRYYYQLQRRKINAEGNDLEGNDFENVGSAVGPIADNRYTFTFPAALEDDNYEYRVIAAGDPLTLTNKNCRTVSNAILLRVYDHIPVIEAVPITVCEGDASALQASILNGTDAKDYEYLWQYENTSTNGEWATVENESSFILNTGPLQETTRYRVQAIKDNCVGQGFSDAVEVKVTVVPAPVASEQVQVFCAIDAPTVADLIASGTDVRWYDASGTLLAPNEALLDGEIYYATQTVDGCESAERLAVTVRINDVNAGAINGNQTTCLGTVPAILASTVDASGVGIVSYRWEISIDEAVWEVIAGATEASYAPSTVGGKTFFRRVAISTLDGLECEAYTEPVAVLIADDCDLTSQKTVVDKNNDGLAQAGEQLTYSIQISNAYDRDIVVTVTDEIPQHTAFVSSFEGDYDGVNLITWKDVKVPAQSQVAVDFVVVVTDNLTGIDQIENVATVTSTELSEPQRPSVRIDTDPTKSFTAAKSADKQSVKAGEELTYTITVTNTGDVDYDGITVSDNIPANTTYKAGSASEGATVTGNTLTWAIDVPFGESREVSFTVVVAEDLTDIASIRNVAKVTGEDPETPEEPETETPTDPAKSFTAAKSADKQSVKAGEELTYTITVTNTGDVDYDGITVSDNIPANTTYKAGSASEGATVTGNTLTWAIDVPFGESREVSFTVVVAEDLTDIASIRNVAKVTGEDPGTPEEPETETPTNSGKQFESVKTVSDATGDGNAQAGEELTYRIGVKNTGAEDYKGITIEDEIPAHTTYVAGSATHGGELANGILSWTIDVPFGKEVVVTFKVKVVEELDGVDAIRNVATVAGGNPDDPEIEHPESPEVPVITGPTANDDQGNTNQGEPITITVLANDTEGSSPLVPGSVRLIDPSTGDKVTTVTLAGEGTYTVGTDGKVTFTPDANYVGNSTIKYTVEDENGLESNEGTIAIIVEGVAAEIAPTAIDDHAITPYGQAVTIPVLSNDQAGSSPIVPSTVKLIDEAGNRVSMVSISGEGRYSVNASGIVTFEPAENFTGTSTVRYEVTDENGLVSNVATITVEVKARQFKIPNVFTPNGDGRNDVFEIVGIEGFDRVEITVVNRWGNEVYRNYNYRNDWSGQGLNEGTYYYVIITHDGSARERYAGWVLIKRQ